MSHNYQFSIIFKSSFSLKRNDNHSSTYLIKQDKFIIHLTNQSTKLSHSLKLQWQFLIYTQSCTNTQTSYLSHSHSNINVSLISAGSYSKTQSLPGNQNHYYSFSHSHHKNQTSKQLHVQIIDIWENASFPARYHVFVIIAYCNLLMREFPNIAKPNILH